MSVDPQSKRSALESIEEAIRLLNLADRSLNEVRGTFEGEVSELATRMSRHLCFLTEVAELLYHEMARSPHAPAATVLPFPAKAFTLR